MKKIIFSTALILVAILISCGDEVLNSPNIDEDNWIKMPENPALGDTTKFDIASKINGFDGGSIDFTKDFIGGPYGQYCVYAKLRVLPGTFASGDTIDFNLSVDVTNTSVIVSPVDSNFTKPLKLTLTYCGIDLSGLNPAEIDFVYGNGIDTFIDVNYDDAVIDTLLGKLEITNAHIEYIPNPVPNGKYGLIGSDFFLKKY
jgi:hypothetical protein